MQIQYKSLKGLITDESSDPASNTQNRGPVFTSSYFATCSVWCNEECVEGRTLKVQQLLEGAAFKIINDGQRGLAAAIS